MPDHAGGLDLATPGDIAAACAGDAAACAPGCGGDDRCGDGDGGPTGQRCCGRQCVDTATDPANCGGCGAGCRIANSVPLCAGGSCKLGPCNSGWGDCDGDPRNGCEAALRVDPMHCTDCGVVCAFVNATAACAAGCYLAACHFGWDDCDHKSQNGCETSVLADAANCGACGVVCPGAPHARAACVNTVCELTGCDAGFSDCNGIAKDGCEVAIATDVSNCGACANACAQGLVCKNGGCTCPQCAFPHARSMCVNQMCVLGACDAGFADCNSLAADGCEVNVGFDPKNCGQCKAVCPMNAPACTNGQCTQNFKSCLDLFQGGKSNGDGIYSIDPGTGLIKVYCDMTSDGGGWTLVHKNNLSGTGDRTDNGWNGAALLDPAVNDVAVLPRATIAAISPASEFRVITVNGYRIFSKGGMPYYTTDNHMMNSFTGGQLKYAWADAYVAAMSPIMPFPQHATLVCPSVNGCTGNDTGHLAVQRFCCGAPDAGFWFNGAQRFNAGYYAGAGWVR